MKIAVTGKGGVGKSTISAMLCHLARADNNQVLAVDADPDTNLAFSLGIPSDEVKNIVPVSCNQSLIEERTGAKIKKFGQIFKLNPKVDDVVDILGTHYSGINLIVMGAIQTAGSGCACPENVFLKSLLSEILLNRNEYIIIDMEAGIEHLGRGTAKSVDLLIIVSEPSPQSVNTAKSIRKFAEQLGVENIRYVGNKTQNQDDIAYLYEQLGIDLFLGVIPFDNRITQLERKELPLYANITEELSVHYKNVYAQIKNLNQ